VTRLGLPDHKEEILAVLTRMRVLEGRRGPILHFASSTHARTKENS
jgi:hypothetical protein